MKTRTVRIVAFSIAKQWLPTGEQIVEAASNDTVETIVKRVMPGIQTLSVRVALDLEYVQWDTTLGDAKEIAIIPPVSGG